jgi:hypothetical protein
MSLLLMWTYSHNEATAATCILNCVNDRGIVVCRFVVVVATKLLEWAKRATITSSATILFLNTTLECLRHSIFFSFTSPCSFKMCIGPLLWRLFSWRRMGGILLQSWSLVWVGWPIKSNSL